MSESLPTPLAQYERYSQSVAERALSDRLNLFWEPQMQDWDLINSSSRHLPALVDMLVEPALTDDERFSLMCLAIASYDELMPNNENPSIWCSLQREILRQPEIYVSVVWYWAQPVIYGNEPFPISQKMASIWEEINDTFIP